MAQSTIYGKDELLAQIKAQLPALATSKSARGWDIVLETWDDATIVKAMGRSRKIPGAIWAIEEQLKPLVAMRKEAQQEDAQADAELGGEQIAA